jgi:hypothetical protein
MKPIPHSVNLELAGLFKHLLSANAFWKNGRFGGHEVLWDIEVPFALDCGGFTTMRHYGGYRWTIWDYIQLANAGSRWKNRNPVLLLFNLLGNTNFHNKPIRFPGRLHPLRTSALIQRGIIRRNCEQVIGRSEIFYQLSSQVSLFDASPRIDSVAG